VREKANDGDLAPIVKSEYDISSNEGVEQMTPINPRPRLCHLYAPPDCLLPRSLRHKVPGRTESSERLGRYSGEPVGQPRFRLIWSRAAKSVIDIPEKIAIILPF
jgi:hypothetical protein